MRAKQWIAALLVLCMVLAWLPAQEVHAEELVQAQAAEIASGKCGWDQTWTLSEDGVLTISGTGNMDDYGEYGMGVPAPWSDYADQIKELVIADTVTSIGHKAFKNCTALTHFEIPSGLEVMGAEAFSGCTGLTTVTIGSQINSFAMYSFAFKGCTNLMDVYVESEEIIGYKSHSWWEYSCLLEYTRNLYVISSAMKVSDVIRMGYACDNAPETVEVNGVSYDLYKKGAHSYNITANDPTCTEDGFEIHACDICGYSYDVYIGATGHEWNEYHICMKCGVAPRYIADESVVLEEMVVVDGIYYTAEGYPVAIALDAPIYYLGSSTLFEYVEAYGEELFSMTYVKDLVSMMDEHGFVPLTEETRVWILDVITGNPAWGETEDYLFFYLGYEIRRDQEHDHQYSTFVNQPTCTEEGNTASVCMICGDTYYDDVVDALGHNYVTEVVPPSCSEMGYTSYICSVCGEYYTDNYVDALEHTYESVVIEPTCTSEGYTLHTCILCGASYQDEWVMATGFGPWIVTVVPTFEAPGEAYRVCADCGATETITMQQKTVEVSLSNLPAAFDDALHLLDMFYEFDAYYMIRITTDYFLDDFDFWDGACVAAEDFETVLRLYFDVDDDTIARIRSHGSDPDDWFYYDEAAQTYTFSFMGGFGGMLPERAFVGYVQNGDTYDVYYAEHIYAYLQDVLPEGVDQYEYAAELGWPYEIEYEGVVYTEGPEGYVAILGLADRGMKYTVEIGAYVVRILASATYSAEDLPDHLHWHEANVVEPTCTQQGYTEYSCSCGDRFEDAYTDMVAHNYVDGYCSMCGEEEATVLASGICGENLTWTLMSSGKLTISGTGDMENYSSDTMPWDEYKEKITCVVIEDGVTSICDYAFFGLSAMADISIAGSVTSIGEQALSFCDSLTYVKLPDGLDKISVGMFFMSKNLIGVDIPESVTNIEMMAFSMCEQLTDVKLPSCLESIGMEAFYCCNLTSVVIPNTLTNIDDSVFSSCVNLTSVQLQDGLTSIGSGMFSGCTALTEIIIPDSVTSIGSGAFFNCTALTSITIPEGVTSIEQIAFRYCSGLTSIVIPASVTTIGQMAFWECSSLTQITFLGDAPSIGENVFYEVTATAYYPADNTTWTSDVMLDYGGTITWKIDGNDVIYDLPEDDSVSIPENDCFEPDTIVSVEKVEEGPVFDNVMDAMETVAELYVAFEFTAMKDGAEAQPNGSFLVTFAIPEGFSVNIGVYYMAEDGTLEMLDTIVDVENRTVSVELTHFSTYILADLYSQPLMGDVNGDGSVDTTDAKLIMQYDLGLVDEAALKLSVADVNGDGKVDTTDAKLIMQLDLGLITEFPKP